MVKIVPDEIVELAEHANGVFRLAHCAEFRKRMLLTGLGCAMVLAGLVLYCRGLSK